MVIYRGTALKHWHLVFQRLESSGTFLRVEKFDFRHQLLHVVLDVLQTLVGEEAGLDRRYKNFFFLDH
jgi:hypothetical protein